MREIDLRAFFELEGHRSQRSGRPFTVVRLAPPMRFVKREGDAAGNMAESALQAFARVHSPSAQAKLALAPSMTPRSGRPIPLPLSTISLRPNDRSWIQGLLA